MRKMERSIIWVFPSAHCCGDTARYIKRKKKKKEKTNRCVSIGTLWWCPLLLWLLWTGAVSAGRSVQKDDQLLWKCARNWKLNLTTTKSQFVKIWACWLKNHDLCRFFSPGSIRAGCLRQLSSTTTPTRLLNLSSIKDNNNKEFESVFNFDESESEFNILPRPGFSIWFQ